MRVCIFLIGLACLAMSMRAQADEADFVAVNINLPIAEAEAAQVGFEALPSLGVVWLEVDMGPGAAPVVDGTDYAEGETPFGPLAASYVSLATGSNHVMVDVLMGTPEAHAGNLLSAHYDPALISETGFGVRYRLTGCYFSQAIAIPTAVQYVLQPMPVEACGFGD